jgi:hypothetical protein
LNFENFSMNSRNAAIVRLFSRLDREEASVAWLTPDGAQLAEPPQMPLGILPGSFNPLHAGHLALRDAAARFLRRPVYFELTGRNADKPPLAPADLVGRLAHFALDGQPVAVTNVPTFAEKARLFAGTTFVVGVDTAVRILQERFYGGSAEARGAALGDVRGAGCRFLVAGRRLGETYLTLRDLDVPAGFADLFVELPEQQFRADVSSTALRGE